jgi:hypothetical protein
MRKTTLHEILFQVETRPLYFKTVIAVETTQLVRQSFREIAASAKRQFMAARTKAEAKEQWQK